MHPELMLMTEITLDLETLGTRPGSVILSIGAVAHVPGRPIDEMEEFYAVIDAQSCYAAGLGLDLATVRWWMEQDAATREEAWSGELSLQYVLVTFAAWLKSVESTDGIEIYGKGPSFDCAILAAAYAATGQSTPWHYMRERCVRTVMAEGGRILGEEEAATLIAKPEMRHHALHDARAEMLTLIAIRKAIAARMAA